MPNPYWIYDERGEKFCSCQHNEDGTVILKTSKNCIRYDSLMFQIAYPEFGETKRNKACRVIKKTAG